MAILGDNSQGSGATNGSSDRIFVTLFTSGSPGGSIAEAYAYFDATSTSGDSAKVVLYNDASGHAGTLVAVSSALSIPNGGGLVGPFTMSGTVAASTNYFVGVVYNGFNTKLQIDSGLSGKDSELYDEAGAYGSPPDLTAEAPLATYSDNQANVWIVYNTGPTITSQPVDTTKWEGQTATFTVSATGSGSLTYQWQRDTGGGFSDIGGETTSTLTLTNVTYSLNGYKYRVNVTDTNGTTTSSQALLTVLVAAQLFYWRA